MRQYVAVLESGPGGDSGGGYDGESQVRSTGGKAAAGLSKLGLIGLSNGHRQIGGRKRLAGREQVGEEPVRGIGED